MPQVSLYVAIVTAAAAVAAAAVSQIPGLRKARQDRRDRHAEIRQQACLDLLSAAEELRASVANAVDYVGEEMRSRLADIRNLGAAVQLRAMRIELLVPGALAGTAKHLASVAGEFIATAVANTDLVLGNMRATDAAELGRAIDSFREHAVVEAAR